MLTEIIITGALLFVCYYVCEYHPKRRKKDRSIWREWDSLPDDALICRVRVVKESIDGTTIKAEDWRFKYGDANEFRWQYNCLNRRLGEDIFINGVFVKNGCFLAIKFDILGVKNFIEAIHNDEKIHNINKDDVLMVFTKNIEKRYNREEKRRHCLFTNIQETFGEDVYTLVVNHEKRQRNKRILQRQGYIEE